MLGLVDVRLTQIFVRDLLVISRLLNILRFSCETRLHCIAIVAEMVREIFSFYFVTLDRYVVVTITDLIMAKFAR